MAKTTKGRVRVLVLELFYLIISAALALALVWFFKLRSMREEKEGKIIKLKK